MAYRILAVTALAVALAVPALADEIRPSGPPIVIPVGSGTLIQSTAPLGNVFVANPETASVQIPIEGVTGRNLVYVFGKVAGKTALYALDENGNVILNRVVDVAGPRTVRVLRGHHPPEIWSEAHELPKGGSLADLPAGSTVTVPVGGARQ